MGHSLQERESKRERREGDLSSLPLRDLCPLYSIFTPAGAVFISPPPAPSGGAASGVSAGHGPCWPSAGPGASPWTPDGSLRALGRHTDWLILLTLEPLNYHLNLQQTAY